MIVLRHSEQRQCFRISLLQQGPAAVFEDPVRDRILALPAARCFQHQLGMGFGDIVQVVRHAFLDIRRRIGFQQFENPQYRRGILLKARQRLSPGQLRTAALAGQPADMLAFVLCPDSHLRHHPLFIPENKRADGEFRRSQRGDLFQRRHGCFPIRFRLAE